jgi:ABC-type multidrug transport system fused ATPase/permease subunit
LMSLAFVVPVAWLAATFGQRMRPVWMQVQAVMGYMGNTLEESLAGVSVVKAFSHQEEDSRVFESQANELYSEQMRAARMMSINMPTMVLVVSLPSILILWYGGHQVVAGSMTIGQVSFQNVSFSYNNLSPALKNVSFEVKPGQLVALLGQSGSGKSTIANLLARFYDVSGGKILVDGIDIRDVTLASLRKNVVTAQQDVFLFSATVRENIAYGAVNATTDKIVEVAKAAYLHDFIEALPDGYETWVGERGDTLSGGEKQRLSIARTLLVDPSILILDDSTASVDSETERLIRQALDRLIKGRTTFIITHRLPIIQNADLILMLQDGELVEQGTHNELIARNGIYKEVYESQLLMHQDSEENW